MDIKAPLSKYASVCGMKYIDLLPVQKSISLIKNSGINYEFRTTLSSELEGKDISRIISDFKISSNYIVQHCRSGGSAKTIEKKINISMIAQQLEQSMVCTFRGF